MPFPAAAIIPLGPEVQFYAFRSAAHVFFTLSLVHVFDNVCL